MNKREIIEMETADDFLHTSRDDEHKLILLGETLKKSWILLPKEIGGFKSNVIESIVVTCICETHLSNLYVLDAPYSTLNCPRQNGWCWINTPTNLDVVRLTGII